MLLREKVRHQVLDRSKRYTAKCKATLTQFVVWQGQSACEPEPRTNKHQTRFINQSFEKGGNQFRPRNIQLRFWSVVVAQVPWVSNRNCQRCFGWFYATKRLPC